MDGKLPFSLFDIFALVFPGAVAATGIYLSFDPTLSLFQGSKVELSSTFLFLLASYILGHVLHATSEILIDRTVNLTRGSIVGRYLETVGLATRTKEKLIRSPWDVLTHLVKIDWDPDFVFKWQEPVEDHEDSTRQTQSAEKTFDLRQEDTKVGNLIHQCLHREFQVVPERINHIFQLVLTHSQKNTKGEISEVPVFAALEAMFRSLSVVTALFAVPFFWRFSSKLGVLGCIGMMIVFILLIYVFYYAYLRYKRMWVETIFAQFIVASSERRLLSQKVIQ